MLGLRLFSDCSKTKYAALFFARKKISVLPFTECVYSVFEK
jgi:hypothetical protein